MPRPAIEAPVRRSAAAFHGRLWPALAVGVALAAIGQTSLQSITGQGFGQAVGIGQGLGVALLDWALFTLPLALAVAVAVAGSGIRRSELRIAVLLLACSATFDITIDAAARTDNLEFLWNETTVRILYAISTALTAAAYLAARGWTQRTLWLGTVAGLVSLPVFPSNGLTTPLFASGLPAAAIDVVLEVAMILVVAIGVVIASIIRRLATTR